MRRFLAWLTCAVGAAWIFRRLRRSVPEPAADPAEELRRKLEDTRTDEQPPAESAEPTEVEAPGLDARRRAMHDRGRAAIDEMRGRGDQSE
jgi:hypothetical protein